MTNELAGRVTALDASDEIPSNVVRITLNVDRAAFIRLARVFCIGASVRINPTENG